RRRRFLRDKPLRVFVVAEDQAKFDRVLSRVRDDRWVSRDELRLDRGDQPAVPVAVHVNTAARTPAEGTQLRWLFHDLTALKAVPGRVAPGGPPAAPRRARGATGAASPARRARAPR